MTIKLEDMSTFPDSPPIFKRMRKYFEEHHHRSRADVDRKKVPRFGGGFFFLVNDAGHVAAINNTKLSPRGVKMFMQSALFGKDHYLYGYPKPVLTQ